MAHTAGSLARLIIAGRKVQWDWLSPLAAVLMFQSAMIYWWFQWSLRDREVVLADLTFRAMACLLLYMLAVAVLPEDSRGRPNLREHFQRSNRLVFGAFGSYVLMVGILSPVYQMMFASRSWEVPWGNILTIVLCILAAFVQRRWLHTIVLLYFLYGLNVGWMTQVI